VTDTSAADGVPQPGRNGAGATLTATMETMFAAGRRSLPPVPQPAIERPTTGQPQDGEQVDNSSDDTTPVRLSAPTAPAAPAAAEADGPPDVGQEFVARLRGAAADFAAAAGAQTAVVREAVPPARHRRSRCRLVLRYADGSETDLTFLGPAGRPRAADQGGFDESIQGWLRSGQRREPVWLVPDEDAADGTAVDVSAWAAAG
jgi:hypothetical protein